MTVALAAEWPVPDRGVGEVRPTERRRVRRGRIQEEHGGAAVVISRPGPSKDYMSDAERASEIDEATSWPDLAVSLYERLTGRGAEIAYQFEDMEVAVPSKVGEDADHAHWRVDGTIRITTEERE